MNKFTKITASIGPKCEDAETLRGMFLAGVNVCRINFSHDTGDVQGEKIDLIRRTARDCGLHVAVLVDLQADCSLGVDEAALDACCWPAVVDG